VERQQLIKLIENKGTSSKEETNELWDIVRAYPYFQTARLLLAKSFHDQGSIHFHNELKTAAAYATDRKVLSRLIRQEAEPAKHIPAPDVNVFAIEQKQTADTYINEGHSESQSRTYGIAEPSPVEAPLFEIKPDTPTFTERKQEAVIPERKSREEIKEEKKTIAPPPVAVNYDEPATTNEEIIRRRLSEILSRSKQEEQEVVAHEIPSVISPKMEETTEPVEAKKEIMEEKEPVSSPLDELPAEPVDAIEGLEIETIIEENYLKELEKLPEITKPAPEPPTIQEQKQEIQEPILQLSFIDWLKKKNAGETTFEELIDEPAQFEHEEEKTAEKPAVKSAELINKFIADQPRITPPAKAEFYNPANMARLSITDNEDITSETLARIYFDQQNYQKARSCYEKLSLLYPEKSAFFAPLIEKIDNLLKDQI